MEEAASVKMPYIILGSCFIGYCHLYFILSAFQKLKHKSIDGEAKGSFFGALRHKHLRWAVVAQFFYVGAQVCVTSSLLGWPNKAVAYERSYGDII